MGNHSNPLASLVVDTDTVATKRLAELLQRRVRIDPVNNAVFIDDETATAQQRVLLALLGRQALAMFERDESIATPPPGPELAPRQVEEITGLPGGTVRRTLGELLVKRLATKDGGYSVPVAALGRVARVVGQPKAE
jgi:hypothetical protein